MMSEIDEKLASYLKFLCQKAKELGASEAVAIPVSDIVVDERVALKCMVPLCSFYGTNLMCPPNVMPISEFKNILKRYHAAILIQTKSFGTPEELTDPVDLSETWKTFKSAGRKQEQPSTPTTDYLHSIRDSLENQYKMMSEIESLCIREGYHFAAGLAGSGCLLCEECVGAKSGLPCRYPFKARPSMDALGIDVVTTAKKAGIQLSFAPNEARSWVGLILVD